MLNASSHSSRPAFICVICNKSFGRQEHLTRHKRIHTQEKPFRCPSCNKRFSRLDVLNRHVVSHGEHDTLPVALVMPRACRQCAADRVRCSRGNPCRRCSQRQLSCSYPPPRRAQSHTRLDPTQTCATADPDCLDPVLDLVSLGTVHDQAMNSSLPPMDMDDRNYDSVTWTIGTENVPVMNDPSQLQLGESGTNWISPHFDDSIDLDTLFAGMVNGNSTQNFLGASSDGNVMEFGGPFAALLQPHTETDKEMSNPKYYVSGSGARAPFKGRLHRRGSILFSVPSHETRSDGQIPSPLPHAETVNLVCPLETYENLVHSIRSERHLEHGTEDVHVPSHQQIQFYVDRYFEVFHPVFPFLCKSSFVEDVSRQWVLLLAVSAIGSKLTGRSSTHGQEEDMSQVLRLSLQKHRIGRMSESDSANSNDLYVPGQTIKFEDPQKLQMLQAGILNVICMLHSGQRNLVDRSLIERHYIVEACRSLHLLHADVNCNESGVVMDHSAEEVRKWRLGETKVRTGMMIWLLDSIFQYTLGERPLMQLDDIQTVLPSHEEVWEDVGLMRSGKRSPCKMVLSAALEQLYKEKQLPPDLGEFSAILLINAVYRHTMNILEREQNSLNLWSPTALVQQQPEDSTTQDVWLPNTLVASNWRNSACDCLDALHWLANSKIAQSGGFEHHTILHLHLARITILTPTNSIQSFATRTAMVRNASSSSQDDRVLNTARQQLLQWVILDQCKARLSIIHCSALYWHVRRYSCDSPIEPYAIYIATLALWTYCSCLNLPEVIAATIENSNVELEPSFLHLDRPLDDELVQIFVREGHKMSAYISKVGDIRERSAPVKILKEGISLLTRALGVPPSRIKQSDGMSYTWGIERSYVQSLHQLLLATAEIL